MKASNWLSHHWQRFMAVGLLLIGLIVMALCHGVSAAAALPATAAGVDITETSIRRTGEVTLQLDGAASTFQVTMERAGGTSTVHGRDTEGRYLVLTNTGKGFSGWVVGRGQIFEIGMGSAISKSAYPVTNDGIGSDFTAPMPTFGKVGGGKATAPDPNERRLDILVLYTNRVKEQSSLEALRSVVAAGVATLDATFANSGLPYSANIVSMEQAAIEDRYEDSTGEFLNMIYLDRSVMQPYRDRYSADLVVFLKGTSEDITIAGRAGSYDGRPIDEEREIAYGVVKPIGTTAANAGITFAHEVGHLLGAGHDNPERGWKTYSSAYRCGNQSLRPYNEQGTLMTNLRPVVPQFSSPDLVDINGVPCGDVETGDNKRTVQLSFEAVSAYSPRMPTYSTITLPSAPIDISESAGVATIVLLRTGDLSKRASVEIATVPSGDRSASNSDFGTLLKRVAFDAGQDRLAVEVPILDNTRADTAAAREHPKQLSLVARYPSAAAIDNDEAVIRILDDEPIPSATPAATTPPSENTGGGALNLGALLTALIGAALRRRTRWGGPGHAAGRLGIAKMASTPLCVLLLTACSSGPSEQEVEQRILAAELQGMDAKVLTIENFEKVNSYEDSPTTRVVEVSYEVVFKVGIDDIDDQIKLARRSGNAMAWSLTAYATKLQMTYGYAKKGDRIKQAKEYRFRETDNGWQLTSF